MMMRQQQMDRRDELERQRRADAQVQMQNTMMQTMMMAMLANSGVPMGGVMQSLNAIQAAGSFQAAAGEGEGARTTARERNETRQRERERKREIKLGSNVKKASKLHLMLIQTLPVQNWRGCWMRKIE